MEKYKCSKNLIILTYLDSKSPRGVAVKALD